MAIFIQPPPTPVEERLERRTTTKPRALGGQETVARGQEWLRQWEARVMQLNERALLEEAALQEYRAPTNPRRAVPTVVENVGRRAAPSAPSPFDEDDAQ